MHPCIGRDAEVMRVKAKSKARAQSRGACQQEAAKAAEQKLLPVNLETLEMSIWPLA